METTAHPRIEFLAPRHHFASPTSPAAANVPVVLSLVRPSSSLPRADFAPEGIAEAEAHQQALTHFLRGLHAERWRGDLGAARAELREAVREAPAWEWPRRNLERLGVPPRPDR